MMLFCKCNPDRLFVDLNALWQHVKAKHNRRLARRIRRQMRAAREAFS